MMMSDIMTENIAKSLLRQNLRLTSEKLKKSEHVEAGSWSLKTDTRQL